MSHATTSQRGGGGAGGGTITDYVTIATGIYLTLALGTAVTLFLFTSLVGGGGGLGTSPMYTLGTGTQLAGLVMVAWILVVFLGPILTTGVAFVIGRDLTSPSAGAVAGAISNVVGVLVTLILLLLLVLVLSPGQGAGGGGLGQLLVALVGVGIGVAITGAAGGALGTRSNRW